MSTKVSVRKLVKAASEKDVAAVSRVLTEAFRSDKFNSLIVGGLPDLLSVELEAVVRAGLVGGEVYVAETPEDGAIGAAVWFSPGKELLEDEEQAAVGFNQFMETLGGRYPEMVPWWMEYFLPMYGQFTTDSLGEGYKHASWHLQYIGVTPSKQLHGVGTALIKHVEAEAGKTASGKTCFCLETEAEGPLAFYKALGYVEKGKTTLEGEKKLNDSVPMWCLCKEID